MSDKLKNYIADNEEHFDSAPTSGHFERFRKLQDKQELVNVKPLSRKTSTNLIVNVAAITVLFLGLGWMLFNLGKIQGAQEFTETNQNNSISTELLEAEFFFTEQVNQKKKEVLAFSSPENQDTKQIMEELKKLELQYLDLKDELSLNQDNPLIINAMIENYRIRLSVLERLLKQLKKSNTIKQKHHDEIQA